MTSVTATAVRGLPVFDVRALVRAFGTPASPFPGRCLAWSERWAASDGRGVIVGLVDTAVDESVADLEGAIRRRRCFVEGGRPGLLPTAHGTHGAVTLAGRGARHVRGLAPAARLLVAAVVGADGLATPRAVAAALEWLATEGAHLIALPLGQEADSPAIGRAIATATTAGAVIFAAAGNRASRPPLYPARDPLVVAVGADPSATGVDLVAPGRDVVAPIGATALAQRSGSSVACVIATGVAALALASGHAAFSGGAAGRRSLFLALSGAPPSGAGAPAPAPAAPQLRSPAASTPRERNPEPCLRAASPTASSSPIPRCAPSPTG